MRQVLQSGKMEKTAHISGNTGRTRLQSRVKLGPAYAEAAFRHRALADFGYCCLDLCDWMFDRSQGAVSGK